jgi:hypothetical protein
MRAKLLLLVVALAGVAFLPCDAANAVGKPRHAGMYLSTSAPIRLDGKGLGIVNFGASTSSATKTLSATLGTPTGHPGAGCTTAYSQTAWHDLIVQFKSGRFSGYRYVAGGWSGISPSTKSLHAVVTPKLATSTGITLGSTTAATKRAYPSVHQTGSDFWSTPTGIVFAFYELKATSSSAEPIYEIKNNVCPGSI